MPLKNKIAVVTGGSRGIGAAISKKLAANGATVAIVYKNSTVQAQSLVSNLATAGGLAAAFAADVSKLTEAKEAIEAIVGQFGRIDIW